MRGLTPQFDPQFVLADSPDKPDDRDYHDDAE